MGVKGIGCRTNSSVKAIKITQVIVVSAIAHQFFSSTPYSPLFAIFDFHGISASFYPFTTIDHIIPILPDNVRFFLVGGILHARLVSTSAAHCIFYV